MTHQRHREEVGHDIGDVREDETYKDMDIMKADVQHVDFEKVDRDEDIMKAVLDFVRADADVDFMRADMQEHRLHEGGHGQGLCEGEHTRI